MYKSIFNGKGLSEMKIIQKFYAGERYNNIYSKQSNTLTLTPSFKGKADSFIKQNTVSADIRTFATASLGLLGIQGLKKLTGSSEADPNITATAKNEEIISQIDAKKQEERLQIRAEVKKQAVIEQKKAKKAAKQAKILAGFERKGVTNISIKDSNTVLFTYQGITYVLTNTSLENVNLYKLLNKVISDDPTVGKHTIKATAGEKEYDCDWGFGKNAIATENMFKLLEDNQNELGNPYFANIIEELVSLKIPEELYEFMCQHKPVALSTQRCRDYLEILKTSNPRRYIEIVTPEKLFETAAGKRYLKINAPEKFDELKKI